MPRMAKKLFSLRLDEDGAIERALHDEAVRRTRKAREGDPLARIGPAEVARDVLLEWARSPLFHPVAAPRARRVAPKTATGDEVVEEVIRNATRRPNG